ncbi:glycoside hydrolase family 3 N-terminal domain-containing protein [Isoptericola luteus]|uniref:glycoside hydrolase family 3 N-terminal domain-containing protein n=1 Tax=Isoptericola luteus TaxID=2879484 RepID=UPI001CE1D246|nr:glycoside hydrolase family 3 N-terminal domain-containing protein [Isoptericola sp. NEAU-Y5]
MAGVDVAGEGDAVLRAVHGVLLPGFTGTRVPAWLEHAARTGLAGVVLFAHNTPDLPTTVALTRRLHELSPDLVVATDEEGGDVSRLEVAEGSSLPGAAALGVLDDERATHDVGEALGRLLASAGVDLDLAPVLDVNHPDNPVIGVRAFGDSPWLVARHGVALARGLHRGGVAACAKHFPGHGSTTTDSHLTLPVVSDDLEVLERRDLAPFVAALAADADGGPGLDALMTAHVVVEALGPAPASLEPAVVALARERGFTGPVVTDALDMRAVSDGADVGEVAVRAVEAGADLLCLGTTRGRDDEALFRTAVDALVAAVAAGRVTTDRLEASAARTAALRERVRTRREDAGVVPGEQAAQRARAALADVGERVAREAVRGSGPAWPPLGDGARPEVVDLRVRLDHAAGRTALHVQHALTGRWPGTVVHPPLGDDAFAELLAALEPSGRPAGDEPVRPLVVVTREPVPGSEERARLTDLRAVRPDLVVVHTGVPTAGRRWFTTLGGAPPAVVLACGTGRANARAAVELLAAGWDAHDLDPSASPPAGDDRGTDQADTTPKGAGR